MDSPSQEFPILREDPVAVKVPTGPISSMQSWNYINNVLGTGDLINKLRRQVFNYYGNRLTSEQFFEEVDRRMTLDLKTHPDPNVILYGDKLDVNTPFTETDNAKMDALYQFILNQAYPAAVKTENPYEALKQQIDLFINEYRWKPVTLQISDAVKKALGEQVCPECPECPTQEYINNRVATAVEKAVAEVSCPTCLTEEQIQKRVSKAVDDYKQKNEKKGPCAVQ